jgi:hypothetical protein
LTDRKEVVEVLAWYPTPPERPGMCLAAVGTACYRLTRMERLLARLERRLGGFALPNLILYVVLGMAVVWVFSLSRPDVQGWLTLDMVAVRHGQVWRLVSFLLIPPALSPFWILVHLYFTWWIGSSLEQNWGAFKFNAYYFTGVLATIVASLVTGPTTSVWLDSSLFLAFATIFPDVSVMLFLLVPIRVKWLGIAAAAFMIFAAATGGWTERAAIAAALVNYVLFFGEHWRATMRGQAVVTRQKARRAKTESFAPVFGTRVCAICGAQEAEGVDIRVCSCDKCGGSPRALCLTHARSH